MASDLSNKEIEDGIKKLLFRNSGEDGVKGSKSGKNSKENRDDAANASEPSTSAGPATSPKKQNKRNRERPKPKTDRQQSGRSGSSENLDSHKPTQGNLEHSVAKSDRVKKDVRARKEKSGSEKTGGAETVDESNIDYGEKGGPPEQKRKRNRGKKKKKSSESPESGRSLSDTPSRSAKSPSPKPDATARGKRSSGKADEIYRQNLAGLGAKNPYMTDVCSPLALAELEKEFLYPLKKRSTKFPTARFFCRLCEYHCDTVGICERHVKDTRHQRLKTIKSTDILLRSLPEPCATHIEVVSSLVKKIIDSQGLSEEQLAARREAFERIKTVVHETCPDTELKLYGSTLVGTAMKDSDTNIDITMDNSPKVLLEVHRLLKEDTSGYFQNVMSEFSAKVPCVYFTASDRNIKCQVAVSNALSVKTSELLAVYAKLDPRMIGLVVLFRYWAKLCRIDRQDEGTLPGYVFCLKTVYFLQQIQPPVLPVLHELVPADKSAKQRPGNEHFYVDDVQKVRALWKTENKQSIGELWIKLLKFYAVQFDMGSNVVCIRQSHPLARQEKKWASKKLAIEDPFFRKRNVARTLSHSQVFEYINDRIRAAFRYYGIPQTKTGPIFTEIDPEKLERKLEENMRCLGEKPNTPDLNANRKITRDGVKSEDSDASAAKDGAQIENTAIDSLAKLSKKVVERGKDPASANTVAKTIIDDLIVEVSECSISPDADSTHPIISEKVTADATSEPEPSAGTPSPVTLPSDSSSPLIMLEKSEENGISDSSIDDEKGTIKPSRNDSTKSNGEDPDVVFEEFDEPLEGDNDNEENESGRGVVRGRNAKYTHTKTSKFLATTDAAAKNGPEISLFDESLLTGLKAEDMIFNFDYKTLSDGKGPAVMCGICQREGHLKQACPEEKLPDLEPLPKMTKDFKDMLDQVLRGVPKDFEPSQRELIERTQVLRELEYFMRETYPDAQLSLFGSSCNGFGFQYSDLDICLTFDEHKSPEGLNCVEIIETLAKKLRKHRGLYNVFAITTAKVPIVKFKHRRTQLDGDISLYNTLAQHNTRMLRMYADIDPRVKVLGYVMKVFAKCCDICDASRGSLSSYAYVLMVLYFLQQRKPPVIPVLQELHGNKKPDCIVDGWNAWFYDDFPSLPKKWHGYGKNRETVGELWVGLLRFYTEEFNFLDYVVSIKTGQQLTRFEKLWNGKCIAIEDPFDHGHNLGSGLSRKMNTYILKAFRKGRKIFGTPFEYLPRGCPTLQDYFFNADNLTEGQPPNDRGCRICGKIGHFAKECPVIQQRKEWKEKGREQRKAMDEHRMNENERSSHADSKPQPIPIERSSYRRSQSYGHTPPDMCNSPGNGPSSLPGNLMYPRGADAGSPGTLHGPQVFYNSNFRAAPDPRHGYSGGSEVQGMMGYAGSMSEGSGLPMYMGMPQSPPVGAPPGAFHFHAPPGSPVAMSTSTTAFPAFYYQYVSVANHAASTNAIDTNTNTERGAFRKAPYYPSQSSQYYQPPQDWSMSRPGNGGNQTNRQRQPQSPAHNQARTVHASSANSMEITVPNERFSRSVEYREQQSNASHPSGQQKVALSSHRSQYNSQSQRFSNR